MYKSFLWVKLLILYYTDRAVKNISKIENLDRNALMQIFKLEHKSRFFPLKFVNSEDTRDYISKPKRN